MHTTKPSAKRQPYSAQYALSESSIVPSVPILVSPSSSGFQSASRKNHSALSFSAANAKADMSAAPQRLMPLGLSALSVFFFGRRRRFGGGRRTVVELFSQAADRAGDVAVLLRLGRQQE